MGDGRDYLLREREREREGEEENFKNLKTTDVERQERRAPEFETIAMGLLPRNGARTFPTLTVASRDSRSTSLRWISFFTPRAPMTIAGLGGK